MTDSTDSVPDLFFFDAFTQIGPRQQKHPAHPWRLQHLLEEMDHCSISGALVSSTQSIAYDPHFGNLELSRQLEPYPRLAALWNVMPAESGEFPAPAELERLMGEHHVAGVTLHPRGNSWRLFASYSQDLLRHLEERRTLVVMRRSEFASFQELEDFLQAHPSLQLVLTGTVWSEQREVLYLVKRYRNLHITFDRFQIHYGLEFLCEAGLEDQLIYASDAPVMSMGAHRCYVDYAEVPVEVRRKIAGGNLARLLGRPLPDQLNINAGEDEIMRAARSGRPLPTTLIDMHMHILHEGLNGAGEHYRMERGGPSGVFPLLERLGCRGGGFMSWNGPVSCDAVGGNECTRAALDAAPKGYWGLGTFDTTHYSQAELERMIPALYEDRRFIGMKPYIRYGVQYDHPSYDVWWEYGHERQFYALIHRVRTDFKEVENLAARYPKIRWVVAHCGASYPVADMAIEAMKKYSNIFAEITLTPVPLGIIDYLVEHAGEDRILYGSDLPMRDPRQQLGWVVFSRLSLEAKQKVLGLNGLAVIAPNLKRLPEHSRPGLG